MSQTMSDAAGYVFLVPQDRVENYLHQIQTIGDRFGEPVSEFELSRRIKMTCLVSTKPGFITYIGRGTRGIAAGTGRRRLNVLDSQLLQMPIEIEPLIQLSRQRFRPYLQKALQAGGLIPPGTFEELRRVLGERYREASGLIERFSSARPPEIRQMSRRAESVFTLEKESVVAALSLAGVPTEQLTEWAPPTGQLPSFLSSIPSARLREDQMIIHDLQTFPGWERVAQSVTGAAVFSSGEDVVTVQIANRTQLEEVLGVDLIYYNQPYDTFVMVQCKALDGESGAEGFRLPNRQLELELGRMESIWNELSGCDADTSCLGYRLNPNPFFLKFCPRTVFDVLSASLIPGMYFPLQYWRTLEQNPLLLGERGGRLFQARKIGRYLGNDTFLALASRGWIGTTTIQSKLVMRLIEELLESGHAVTFAVHRIEERVKKSDDDSARLQ